MNYVGYFIDAEGNKYYQELEKTEWIKSDLSADFKPYNDNEYNIPHYKKIAQVLVEINGTVSPTKVISASNLEYVLFTLPERI